MTLGTGLAVLGMFVLAGIALYALTRSEADDLRGQIEADVLAHIADIADAFADEQDDPHLRWLAYQLADRLYEEVPDHGA